MAFNSAPHIVVCIWKSSKNCTMKVMLVVIAPYALFLTLSTGPLCAKLSAESSTVVMFAKCPRVQPPMLDYTYPCLYPTQPWENISWTETQSCDHQSEWVFRSDVHMTQLNLVWLDHFSGRTDDPDTFSQSDGWLILKKCPSWFSQNAHLWLEIMDAALMRSILTPASSYGCSIVVRLRIFLHL